MSKFTDALNEQLANEFAASQQYIAIAVYYDGETLPQLASHFYRQAVEERNHAMIITQYLLDAQKPVTIPSVAAPRTEFADLLEPVRMALEQEQDVTRQIEELAQLARAEGDLVGEQFLAWFLKEQLEEMAAMADLLHHRRTCPRLQHPARRGLPGTRGDGRRGPQQGQPPGRRRPALTTTPPDPKATLHRYLRVQRDQLVAKLDGLGEGDIRRPMTPTGTNLLGLVKHVASVQIGYFGEVFDRPHGLALPWFDDDAEVNADLWATADETREGILELHADLRSAQRRHHRSARPRLPRAGALVGAGAASM